jgi:hypothetical protein
MPSAHNHRDTHAGGSAYGIWPKLAALHNSGNPLGLLLQMARHHDGCIPLRMQSQRVFLITEAQHFKHVLQTNSANYTKYLDGMTPIFGGSMITMDGALWQKMRGIQQPAFHPDMMCEYIPHFLAAIGKGRDRLTRLARSSEPVDICEETWALAADMTCKALFDRETPSTLLAQSPSSRPRTSLDKFGAWCLRVVADGDEGRHRSVSPSRSCKRLSPVSCLQGENVGDALVGIRGGDMVAVAHQTGSIFHGRNSRWGRGRIARECANVPARGGATPWRATDLLRGHSLPRPGRGPQSDGCGRPGAAKNNSRGAVASGRNPRPYGQLARARLGLDEVAELRSPPEPADAKTSEVLRAASILYRIGEGDLAMAFVTDLAEENSDPGVIAGLGKLTARYNDAQAMLLVGKAALARGMPMDHYAYPDIGVPGFSPVGSAIDRCVVYSIVRTESGFDQRDMSAAKAVGLMQVTPEPGATPPSGSACPTTGIVSSRTPSTTRRWAPPKSPPCSRTTAAPMS